MAIVAGIDEAGFGPLMGPLVVAAAAFRVPEDKATADLWDLLQIAHASDKKRAGGVKVADSKALHKSKHGLQVLEENVLPFLWLLDKPSGAFSAFLRAVDGQSADRMADYPWYHDRDLKLPRKANPVRVKDRARQLQRCLDAARCAFCGVRAIVLNVADYNSDIALTDNKSVTLTNRTGALILHLWETYGHEGVRLKVDKQGGRDHYMSFLKRLFPDCRIVANVESAKVSGYWIEDDTRALSIVFQPKADQDSLPTALASMFCKYARELHMELLNTWWADRVPDLKPTAGYYTDGQRFLSDIAEAMEREAVPRHLLVRCR